MCELARVRRTIKYSATNTILLVLRYRWSKATSRLYKLLSTQYRVQKKAVKCTRVPIVPFLNLLPKISFRICPSTVLLRNDNFICRTEENPMRIVRPTITTYELCRVFETVKIIYSVRTTDVHWAARGLLQQKFIILFRARIRYTFCVCSRKNPSSPPDWKYIAN